MNIRSLCIGFTLGLLAVAAHADQIDDLVTDRMKKQDIPGVSIAVLKQGKVVKIKGYGTANLESGTAVTPQTVFEIGSVSKQFISAGILLLARDGKLRLDDSVRQYITDAPDSWQPITLRHLMSHTSGLVRELPLMQQMPIPAEITAIRAGFSAPLSFKPGDRHEYSNLGYFTLAEVITRAAGKPWPQYLQERIFAPLAMTATRTTTYDAVVPHRANGYVSGEGGFRNALRIQGVRPSGAFLSTVQDLAKWDAALYTDAVLTAPERELMWTGMKLNDGSAGNYGFGWEVRTVGNHRLVRHGGTMPGFRADISRYLDDRVTVIALSNNGQVGVDRIALSVAALQIDGLLPSRKAVKLPASALDAFAGRYQVPAGVLVVSRRDGQLALTMTAGSRTLEVAVLTPEGKTSFFDEDNPRSTYLFESDAQGRMHIVQRMEDGRENLRGPKL